MRWRRDFFAIGFGVAGAGESMPSVTSSFTERRAGTVPIAGPCQRQGRGRRPAGTARGRCLHYRSQLRLYPASDVSDPAPSSGDFGRQSAQSSYLAGSIAGFACAQRVDFSDYATRGFSYHWVMGAGGLDTVGSQGFTDEDSARFRAAGWWSDSTLSDAVRRNAERRPSHPAYVDHPGISLVA